MLDRKLRAGWCVIKRLCKYEGSSEQRVLKIKYLHSTVNQHLASTPHENVRLARFHRFL